MTSNNGGPAFPAQPTEHLHGGGSITAHHGMSLRDWFAGQALSGILSGGFADTVPHDDIAGGMDAAHFAYVYADAMLAAREATE